MKMPTQRTGRRGFPLLAAALAALLPGCSSQQILDTALSKDPKAALSSLGKSKVESYKRDPKALLADFERLRVELTRLFDNLRQESEKKWGKEEAETMPGPKRYVKYTGEYKNRIIVDYEKSQVRIEHIQEPQAVRKLRGAIVVALQTPEDPRSVDVFTDKDVVLEGKPFLQDLVLNQEKRPLLTRADVERFADHLVAKKLQYRRISVGGSPVEVVYVEMDLIGAEQDRLAAAQPPKPARKPAPRPAPQREAPPRPGAELPDLKAGERPDPNQYAAADRIAPKFLPLVNKYAKTTGVDPALIFGIIYQESRFNPHAVSPAEAYGMMQLVPRSGGLEAFRKAKGESVQPSREYLMDPENNIELGATYVSMLLYDYWTKNIENMPSREYCVISGYNTGPGNVARAFAGSTSKVTEARSKANAMRPDEIFDYLRVNLPYEETRNYLLRVAAARRHYKDLFYPGTP